MGKETLGRYEIVGEIAQYRVGTIIKATDPKTKQTVALKTFRLDATEGYDQELLKRFRTEAEEARALSSPNIVTVLGTGEDKGVFFAVLEFVDGIRIFDMLLSKKEMSTGDLVDISRQVCSALDHAASKKIVHRNLKPANVMVEWDGGVKIMDYGVPSGVEVGAPGPKNIPQLLYYMAPEQIQRAPIDVRANIYNWGAMLYELISGQKAAAADTREEVCKKILGELPPPLTQLVPGVPPGINHVVMKALAKNPADRYQNGAELINDIENYKQFGRATAPAPAEAASVRPAIMPPNIARPETFSPPIAVKPITPPPIRPAAPSASPYAANPVTPEMMSTRPVAPPPTPGYGTFNASPANAIPLAPKAAPSAQSSVAVAPEPIPGTVEAQQPKQESKVVHPLVVAAPRNKPVLDSTVRISTPTPPIQRPAAPRVSVPPVAAAPAPLPRPKPKKAGFDLADRKNQAIAGGAVLVLLVIAVLVGLQFGHNREEVIQPSAGNALSAKPEPLVSAPAQLPAQSPEVLAAEQQQSEPEVVYSKKDKKKKTAVKPVVSAAPTPITGELAINSSPAGAQIQIDGRSDPSWVTPLAVTVYAGPHSVVVSKPGFTSQSQNIEVTAANRATVSLSLTEMSAIAAVNSDPAGASIYVDGRDSGKLTPAQLSVPKGSHTITVKRLGYFEASQSVELVPGQTAHYSPSLKPMGDANEVRSTNKLGKLFGGGAKDMGVVKIKTAPKGAQITINNRMMDRATPAEFAVPPGNYQIVLTAPGYKPLQKMITLQSGDRLNLDEVLEK
jgi:eukaryotic-like serine/threonine-protein kinase